MPGRTWRFAQQLLPRLSCAGPVWAAERRGGQCGRLLGSGSGGAATMTQLRQGSGLPGRPEGAEGAYLRILSITDTYSLHYFPHVVQVSGRSRLTRPPR